MRPLRTLLISCVVASCLATATDTAAGLELQPPVAGSATAVFNTSTTRYSAGHRGVDLAASPGDPVHASAAGTVHFAGTVAGRPTISVDHGGGLRTTYTPAVPVVSRGQTVRPGDVIGTVGADEHCRSACLHWGLTDGTDHFDPMAQTGTPGIRLLPRGATPQPRTQRVAALEHGQLPVAGRSTSAFGMRTHPITGTRKLHDGTDIAAACGTPVRTPWPGSVVASSFHAAYGYRVIVDHGGLRTAYAHMRGLDVRVGDHLSAGARLGSVGSTGLSTGCHLHWMAWQHGSLVDPLTLVG